MSKEEKEKPKSKRALGVPSHVNDIIIEAIWEAEARLNADDADSVTNPAVVGLIERNPKLKKSLATCMSGMVRNYLAKRVADILGADSDSGFQTANGVSVATQPLMPGLEGLPLRTNCPARAGLPSRWKRDRDLTPQELEDVIASRKSRQSGWLIRTGRYQILLDTAKDRGCKPDEPISTVFRKTVPA